MSVTRHQVVLWAEGRARSHRLEESVHRLADAKRELTGCGTLAIPGAAAATEADLAEHFEFIVRALREGEA